MNGMEVTRSLIFSRPAGRTLGRYGRDHLRAGTDHDVPSGCRERLRHDLDAVRSARRSATSGSERGGAVAFNFEPAHLMGLFVECAEPRVPQSRSSTRRRRCPPTSMPWRPLTPSICWTPARPSRSPSASAISSACANWRAPGGGALFRQPRGTRLPDGNPPRARPPDLAPRTENCVMPRLRLTSSSRSGPKSCRQRRSAILPPRSPRASAAGLAAAGFSPRAKPSIPLPPLWRLAGDRSGLRCPRTGPPSQCIEKRGPPLKVAFDKTAGSRLARRSPSPRAAVSTSPFSRSC